MTTMTTMKNLRIIVAHDRCRGIGKNGTIPWYIPEDLKRFRHLTNGNIVVMGRATYDSIPEKYRPLPNRFNIVMTRNPPPMMVVDGEIRMTDVFYSNSMDAVKQRIAEIREKYGNKDVDIIGGTEIYKQWLPETSILEITEVDGDHGCDRQFPDYFDEFECVWESSWYPQGYRYTRWTRRKRE
jgi:dihydrofolate reductase